MEEGALPTAGPVDAAATGGAHPDPAPHGKGSLPDVTLAFYTKIDGK